MPLPTGTITFLFTDIEGSAKLWERYPDAMRLALAHHDVLLRDAIERHNGYVFKTVGDAFCAAFPTAVNALDAALEAHLALAAQEWGETGPIRVRMGLHTGDAEERDSDYFGPTLNRAARLQGVGHGQQTLLSQATSELVKGRLPAAATLSDMGQHRLKDLASPEHVWQLLHSSLPQEFPPLKSLNYLPTNLPQQVTSFIGREKEMAVVKALLQKTRLLTLTGSGGTGKTRLCLQVAAEVLEQFSDGVWLVELASLADPSLVPQTVADVVGIREIPGEPITKTLLSALKDKQMLLVLDNCEHLLETAARLVDGLLHSCPKVSVLVSSRQALGITGESAYRVPSLSVPDGKQPQIPESLAQYEAVHLFMERATAVKADFKVTHQNASAVASVCHRLDGIPLAIELGAARIRSMTVEELGRRLDDRFRILTGGNRTALPRHQTLRAMMDWSYDLLEENQKALLARLSVFAGGWTLEAAEKVGVGGEIETGEILDLLTALDDKSLVIAEERGETTRYRLLETVRQYGSEKLHTADGANYRRQHLAHFLSLAEAAEPTLTGSDAKQWLERLEVEHDNLRSALVWCAEAEGNAEEGLRLAGALWRFWEMRGYLSEGRTHLLAALSHEGASERTKERANALNGAGNLAANQSNYVSARSLYEESLAIRQELGDKRGIASSLGNLGMVTQHEGDFASARSLQEESLTIWRELGDKWRIALSLSNLGNLAYDQGDNAASGSLQEEGLAIWRELGDKWGLALSLNNLGGVAYSQGNYASARSLYTESLEIRWELGDKLRIAETLAEFARLLCAQSQEARAARLWGAAEAFLEEVGAPLTPANHMNYISPMTLARTVLSIEAFDAAWAEGRGMTIDQAIALARKESNDRAD